LGCVIGQQKFSQHFHMALLQPDSGGRVLSRTWGFD